MGVVSMQYLKAMAFFAGVTAMNTGALALEPLRRLSDSELASICMAKRGTVAQCECIVKTMKKIMPIDDVNLTFWRMWVDPARAKAYADAKAKEQPQWAKAYLQRGGLAMRSMNTACENAF